MHDMTTNISSAMQPRRTFIVVLLLAMTAWPGTTALAAPDTPRNQKTTRPRPDAQKPLQAVRPRQPVACSEFGPGFVRMPGSDSCMRMGGGVGLGVGAVP